MKSAVNDSLRIVQSHPGSNTLSANFLICLNKLFITIYLIPSCIYKWYINFWESETIFILLYYGEVF